MYGEKSLEKNKKTKKRKNECIFQVFHHRNVNDENNYSTLNLYVDYSNQNHTFPDDTKRNATWARWGDDPRRTTVLQKRSKCTMSMSEWRAASWPPRTPELREPSARDCTTCTRVNVSRARATSVGFSTIFRFGNIPLTRDDVWHEKNAPSRRSDLRENIATYLLRVCDINITCFVRRLLREYYHELWYRLP